MKNVKKIGLIIIAVVLTILTVILANKVVAETPSRLNDIVSVSSQNDLLGNYKYYCIERGQQFNDKPTDYIVKAIVKITGTAATITTETDDEPKNSVDAAKANWILSSLLYDAEISPNELYPRLRTSLDWDSYQQAVWIYMKLWAEAVFGPESKIYSYIGESGTSGKGYSTNGRTIVDWYEGEVNENVTSSGASISKNSPSDEAKLETNATIGDYTVIGPFNYSFTRECTITVSFSDESNKKITATTSLLQYNGDEAITISNPENNKDFYVKVKTSDIQNAKKITIEATVSNNLSEIKSSTIYFMIHPNDLWQNLIYVDVGKESAIISDSITNTFELDLEKTLIIQKQDASGNNLKVEGIQFEIYDSSNTKIGTLTTDKDGKTNSVSIEPDKQYTIKEISNNAYGYKACEISGAKVISGTGTVSESDEGITVQISTDATIAIKNTPKLGQLIIDKLGEDNQVLQGVEFVVYKGNKYLKLNDESVTTPITTSNTGIDMSGATTVDTAKEATKFITNSSGKIVLNNLEIYKSKSEKYEYWVYESSNDNYGYKDPTLGEITVIGGTKLEKTEEYADWAHFNIETNTTVKIENIRQLGILEIAKVGNSDIKLPGVEFIVEIDSGKYLQLKDSSGNIVKQVTGKATINKTNTASSTEYAVAYVTSKDEATTFITDENGKITIENLEVNKANGKAYNYTVHEINNSKYGYAATDGASINSKIPNLTNGQTTTVNITNNLNMGNLEIVKVNKDNQEVKLSGVEFKIEISSGSAFKKYLAIYNQNGFVSAIEEAITINLDNVANTQEYRIEYVDNQKDATTFITNKDGKIVIKNLETNKSATETYSYTAYEINNPNYGYGNNTDITAKVTKLTLDQTNTVTIANNQELGNIAIDKLGKHDIDNTDLKLSNVGFIMKIKSDTKENYLALYDENGKFVPNVKSLATINSKNVANSSEYRVEYVTNQNDATIFLTGDKGELRINNLEKYELYTRKEYKYNLIEISNPYYGYTATATSTDITINKDQTTEIRIPNKQTKIKISGYVWIEHSVGKASAYDGIYSVSNDNPDKKLTDLYITKGEELIKNRNAEVPVEIKLRDRKTGKIIKEMPDLFDSNGKYTFEEVEIANLSNYEVVFIYDGFYYTTIATNLTADNGSKAKELEEERTDLNNKFGKVKDNNEIVPTGENKIYTPNITYNKIAGHESVVSSFNINTSISATTYTAEFYLDKKLDEMKTASTPTEEIDNVNMGIVLREQPKIQIGSDIYQVYVEVNERKYTYDYNSRGDFYENIKGDEVGVKFEQENLKNRYTKTVYASDVQALQDGKTEMKVSIVYRIKLSNKSTTLTSIINEITNYYDSRYTIESIGSHVGGTEYRVTSTKENINVEGAGAVYNGARIELSDGIQLKAGENRDIYIKFNISKDAIIGLLNNESTYHNATEIMSYTTLYGAQTNQIIDAQTNRTKGYFTTDETKEGNIYAGVDKSSQVGNIELKLVDHQNGGTKVLDTTNFEDDTTSAPSFVLEAEESRKISGTIWEDSVSYTENNESLGDGKFDTENEKPIADVVVRLYNVNDDGTIGDIAKYSDGITVVESKTGNDGTYTFGYTDETGKHIGILPGKYVIIYTYNCESYIVSPSGNTNINVNDYKSTIITSNTMKDIFKQENITYNGTNITKIQNTINERWYLINETDSSGDFIRYSDARDNIELRNSLDNQEVKYSNYQGSKESEYIMNAYTPLMNIGVEFTPTDNGIGYTLDKEGKITNIDPVRVESVRNVDFGIIERPKLHIETDKTITGLEIVAQNGTSIIPKGNPSDTDPNNKMQYVKKLDDMVSVEIESSLLQGAKLNLEYTITLKSNFDTDYKTTEYYYYGENKTNPREMKLEKIADYLDADLSIDWEKTNASGSTWTEYTNNIEELYNNGYISEKVRDELNTKNYTVLIAGFEEGFEPQEEKVLTLYATKYLAVSQEVKEQNSIEILALSGGTVKDSIPGNYSPADAPKENDEDQVKMVITPPTGLAVNYTLYIIAAVVTSVILVSGIIIIKKKIIK